MSNTKPIVLKTDSGRRENHEISFAQNLVKYRDKSNLRSNEPGNIYSFEVPTGYVPIGTISISRYDTIIFSCTEGTINVNSEIGLFNSKDQVYTTLINHPCLGFLTSRPVNGLYELRNGCERIIVFWDFYNSDKLINIDDLDSYKTDDDWDCNKMALDRQYVIPYINDVVVLNGGGKLKIGSYAFAVELLDDSLNTVYISDMSPSVPIIYDSLNINYDSISGAKNIDNTTELDGGKPETNKSIQVNIANLDTRFKYFRVIISRRLTGNGQTLDYIRDNNLYNISKSTFNYVYRGGVSGFQTVDSQSVLINQEKYSSSFVIEKVGKKLVRFNLKGENRDYAAIQSLVNDITVEWITKQVNAESQLEKGNSKNPNTYFDTRSFPRDEIVSLGISFLYDTGQETPVFPLIGRAKSTSDSEMLTVVETASNPGEVSKAEVEHLGLMAGQTVERWKTQNTSAAFGELGYYETDNDYPSSTDCDGERIYPEGKVRLFRLPDTKLAPIYSTDGNNNYLNILGLEFDNIVYPDGVISHKFHMVKRTDENKTVLDMGIMIETRDASTIDNYDSNVYNFDYYGLQSNHKLVSDVVGFISPKVLGGYYLNTDYFKFINLINPKTAITFQERDYKISGTNGEIETFAFKQEYIPQTNTTFTNRAIDSVILLAPNSQQSAVSNITKPIYNHSYSNSLLVSRLLNSPDRTQSAGLYIVSAKQQISPYNNFETLEYIPISKYLTLSDDQEIYGGDVFLVELNVFNLWSLSFFQERILGFIPGDNDYQVYSEFTSNIWIESEINYDLRVEGIDCNSIYDPNIDLNDYTVTRVSDLNTEDSEYLLKNPCEEYYDYNLDYNFYHHGRTNFILPVTFDYCSKCSNLFPNRYIWSQDSLSEELQNGWLVFLSENYAIVGENTGSITAAHFDKNRLLVRTERSRFSITPNPQVINTDENTAYLGSGDFFSIPPNELVKTNYGFAGGQGFRDELNTEFGLVSVDIEGRAIHLFTPNGIETISSEKYGNYEFFQKYLNFSILHDAIQLVYDINYKRILILHKYNDWILSFDMQNKHWLSFHKYYSYIPFIFGDGFNIYSNSDNKFFKHLTENSYCIFNETKQDFIVEIQPFDHNSKDLHSVIYYSQSFVGEKQVRFPTFDRLWVYTNKQSTGIVKLIPKSINYKPWSITEKTIVNIKDNYKVNALRDISLNNSEVYIGRVDQKEPININTSDRQFKDTFINDKYFNIRLFAKPDSDVLILIDIIFTLEDIKNL